MSHSIDGQRRMNNHPASIQIIPPTLQRPPHVTPRSLANAVEGSTSHQTLPSPTPDFGQQQDQTRVPEAKTSDQPSLAAHVSHVSAPSNGYDPRQASAIDGRGRPPVPGELMAKANATDGNFAVMQMGVKPVVDARYLAAKRTSELTQAAAMMAGKNGYQSVKRSKLAWNPSASESGPATGTSPDSTPFQGHQQHSQSAASVSQSPAGPDAAEVKAEQARLLTFLRTIQPLIVVDQICKALAYFGGIPGAPPPPDGSFPTSARANGSGSLLVGWLSEIFPPADLSKPPFSTVPDGTLDGTPVDASRDQEYAQYQHQSHGAQEGRTSPPQSSAPILDPTPVKRGRGRPKGSKSTKTRKDKGMKKLASAPASNEQGHSTNSSHVTLAGWDGLLEAGAPPMTGSHVDHAHTDSSTLGTPGSTTRKRGRPKGSKNRPKTNLEPSTLESSSQVSPISQNTGSRGSALEHDRAHTELSPYPASTNQTVSTAAEMGHEARFYPDTSSWGGQQISGSQQSSGPGGLPPMDSPTQKRKSMLQARGGTNDQHEHGVNDVGVPQPPQYYYSGEAQPSQVKRQRLAADGQIDSQGAGIDSQTSTNPLSASPVMNRALGTATPTQPNRSFHSQSPVVRQHFNTGYSATNQHLTTAAAQRQQPPTRQQQTFQPQLTRSPGSNNSQPNSMQAGARKQLPGNQMQQQQLSSDTQHGYYGHQRRQQAPGTQFAPNGSYIFGHTRLTPNKNFSQHTTHSNQSPVMPSSNLGSSYAQYAGDGASGESGGDAGYIDVGYDMSGDREVSQSSATAPFSQQNSSGQLAAALAEPSMREQMYQAMGRR
jgi:hypothetical protein